MARHRSSKLFRTQLIVTLALTSSGLGVGCGSSDDTAGAYGGNGNGYGGTSGVPAGGGAAGHAGATGTAGHAPSAGSGGGGTTAPGGGAEAGAAGALGGGEPAHFALMRTDLDSDRPGAAQQDAHLLNAWGIAINPGAQLFWVAANHDGRVPVYDAAGALKPLDPKVAPVAGTDPGSPTGQVFNGGTNFMADKFIVATEDGQILGWPGTGDFTQRAAKADAGYKGLALVGTGAAQMVAATDFHDGTVDLYGTDYAPLTKAGAFTDATIPAGFAPFNVMPIGDSVYVTYAKQDAEKADDEAGLGNGYLSMFGTDGTYRKTLVSGGALNSPWAVALAPASYGALAGTLLVGNFGDGAIHAYDPASGALVGQLTDVAGDPLIILGLWDLKVGPTGATDLSNTLFFSAGPGGEAHGVFGKLEVPPAK